MKNFNEVGVNRVNNTLGYWFRLEMRGGGRGEGGWGRGGGRGLSRHPLSICQYCIILIYIPGIIRNIPIVL